MTVKASDLQPILDDVLHKFDYTSDIEERGVFEHWVDLDELAGLDDMGRGEFDDDCDGCALACRFRCRELGYESRLVFCRTETGEGHLVLEVDGWILDNRSKWVRKRDDVPYDWISISGYEKGDPWHLIKPDPSEEGAINA